VVENREIGGRHRDGEQPASLELVPDRARRVEGEPRQRIDEPRPAPGVLVAFEPAAGDGGLYHPQAAVPNLGVVEPVEGLSRAGRIGRLSPRPVGRHLRSSDVDHEPEPHAVPRPRFPTLPLPDL
jgi:hypothetical protein